jgi:hypothetical protein
LNKWTTSESRNKPSNINVEEEVIGEDLRNDGNASMPEQVKRPNPWKKMMMMMMKTVQRDKTEIGSRIKRRDVKSSLLYQNT